LLAVPPGDHATPLGWTLGKILGIYCLAIDLPLSVVADTVALPWTISPRSCPPGELDGDSPEAIPKMSGP
jgi:hypothetical protein